MRTNVVLDEALVTELLNDTGIKTKRKLLHEALLALKRERTKANFHQLKGRLKSWEGNLNADRSQR